MPYDAQGQPLAATLADYLLPGATEVPDVRIDHMETPSPWTSFGQKGIGESGAIGPPAAIVNAINDALAPLGAEVLDLPATPPRVLAAIAPRGRRNEARRFRLRAAGGLAGGLAARRRPARGRSPARNRSARCSTFAWRSLAPIADLRHLPGYAGVAAEAACCASAPAPRTPRSRTARCPGRRGRIMASVARRIAYRAVRNRGTIGGSLAHADPAADWVAVLPRAWRDGIALGPRGDGASRWRSSSPASSRPRSPRTSCSRRRSAGVAGRRALGPLEVLPQARRVLQGDRPACWPCRSAAPRAVLAALDGAPLVDRGCRRAAREPGGRSRAASSAFRPRRSRRVAAPGPPCAWHAVAAEAAEHDRVSLTVNGEPVQAESSRAAPRRPAARRAAADRHAYRLRARRVRRLHGRDRRRAGALLHHLRRHCDGAGAHHRGLRRRCRDGRLREAFSREHALQCGYCTPGMLVTARDIVLRLPDADEARVARSWPATSAAAPAIAASSAPSSRCWLPGGRAQSHA